MNASFERISKGKEEWLTPPHILKALGQFDLDPCAPQKRPWPMAKTHYTKSDDGLIQKWFGRVWCNPPYGKKTKVWLDRCVEHGNAIALTFARTDTKLFYENVWAKAHAVLFIKGRLKFYRSNGKEADSAGAPSILIAYGKQNINDLRQSKIKGLFVQLK